MAEKKNVRLVDIAKSLELTVNTVSRALRDKSDIGEETKELIKKTAFDMGYIPNTIASSLRKGSSKTIAIVFDNLTNPYFMIMADKIHRKLEPMNYATMIFAGNNGQLGPDELIPIVSRKVDGILTFLEPTQATLALLKRNDIPIVLIGRVNTALKVDSISTNDFQGAYEIGKLFIERGSKRCGYIGAPDSVENSKRRFQGYKTAIQDLGGSFRRENLRYMGDESIEEDLDALLANGVDAIFCFNDMMALEVYSLLIKKGKKVPEQVRVAGFDHLKKEFVIPINLTTIGSDKDGIIALSIETLMTHIRGETKFKDVQLTDFDVELIEGDTT